MEPMEGKETLVDSGLNSGPVWSAVVDGAAVVVAGATVVDGVKLETLMTVLVGKTLKLVDMTELGAACTVMQTTLTRLARRAIMVL